MSWFRRRRAQPAALVDDGSLRLVGSGRDPVRGDSAVLDDIAAAGQDPAAPVLVRQLFELHDPADRSALVAALAETGYEVSPQTGSTHERVTGSTGVGTVERVVGRRTQVVTVLAAAQVRARMTGLETRLAVRYLGWEALAPPEG